MSHTSQGPFYSTRLNISRYKKESQECVSDSHIKSSSPWLPGKRDILLGVAIQLRVCSQAFYELTTFANHSWLIFILGTFYKMDSVIDAGSNSASPTSSCKYSLIIFCLGSRSPCSTLLFHKQVQHHFQAAPAERNTKATSTF